MSLDYAHPSGTSSHTAWACRTRSIVLALAIRATLLSPVSADSTRAISGELDVPLGQTVLFTATIEGPGEWTLRLAVTVWRLHGRR